MSRLENNPYYQKALEFIKNTDLNSLEPGRHSIDGDNLYVNICDPALKTPGEAKYEAHDAYIDLQIPLSKTEAFGVKPRSECSPAGEMDSENDIIFFADPIKDDEIVTVKPGDSIVFCPDQAHAPLIAASESDAHETTHKAIFKIHV
jgi:uncharacterized protein, YhcH/YjgK/YiaL family